MLIGSKSRRAAFPWPVHWYTTIFPSVHRIGFIISSPTPTFADAIPSMQRGSEKACAIA